MSNVRSPASMKKVLCVVALLWLVPVVFSPEAHAARGSGLYLAADLGMALSSTSDFQSADARGQTDFDSGLGYSAAVGLGWGGLRMEGEVSWRRSDLDAIDFDQLSIPGENSRRHQRQHQDKGDALDVGSHGQRLVRPGRRRGVHALFRRRSRGPVCPV